jgi:exodeoxyribonuclease V alpha subunit
VSQTTLKLPMAAAMPPTTRSGVVDRVTFSDPESQWTVARLAVRGERDRVTIVGTMAALTPGESVRVHGRWKRHAQYGLQLEVIRYESVVPATAFGIRRYLGSGLIKGIGPIVAAKLVEAFGVETLKVIEETPERLLEIPGIGKQRQDRITTTWAEQREVRGIMLWLQGHQISPHLAGKIWRAYGPGAISVVQSNPYRLARDIRGIGFKRADAVAEALGIPKDSPFRATAAVFHTLQKLTDDGHVYVPAAVLHATPENDLEIPADLLPPAIPALLEEDKIICEDLPEGQAVYLTPLHIAESRLARRLSEFLRAPRRPLVIDIEQALAWVEAKISLTLTPQQRDAVRLALQEKLVVITGGPGTGKTTILNTLIKLLETRGLRIHLASPTGRAAKRLSEVTGRPASTLHKLLEYSRGQFRRTRQHPLDTDVVIVDEGSMVDLPLMCHLVQALPLPAALVLVGDADQLPSAGPGTVLRDLLDFDGIPSIRLTTIFRQAQRSRIITNAYGVNHGEMPDLSAPGRDEVPDCYFIEQQDPVTVRNLVVQLVSERLPRRYGYDPFEDIQVLVPMHRGEAGVAQLNAALQARLNAPAEGKTELTRGSRRFRVGDRVLEYDFQNLDELMLAYATSVHKSQGSEYPCCVLVMLPQYYLLLQRNVLYTGLTRARTLLVLVGTRQALGIAVHNNKIVRRYSHLTERLAAFSRDPPPLEPTPEAESTAPLLDLLNEGLTAELA